MSSRRVSLETVGYLLAIAVALLVRFASLSRLPLTDREAALALQSLNVAKGIPFELSPQPGYILLTGLLFFMTGAGDFLARFWPAVTGSLLVLAPFLFRRQLGRPAALILAFALALDPGLAALSRQAGGDMLAVTFTVLAAGFALNHRPGWTGIFAGLALLGGTYLWPGLVVLILASWASGFLGRRSATLQSVEDEEAVDPEAGRISAGQAWSRIDIRTALIFLGLTLLAAGTLFLRWPAGLSAVAASLPAYLHGWVATSDVISVMPLLALLGYQPLALILGVWGILRALREEDLVDRFLALWWVLSLILVLIYPGRQVTDLAWSIIPLWALAARQSARIFVLDIGESIFPTLAQGVLAFVLVIFAWMNLSGLFNPAIVDSGTTLRLGATLGAVVLLGMTSLLMGFGWTWKAMRMGLVWGLGLCLALFTLSSVWHASGLSARPEAELYNKPQIVKDEDLLVRTIGDLAMWHNGNREIIDLAVVGVPSPALKWALRDFSNVDYVDALPPSAQPSVVITADQQTLASAGAYRGQDFVWYLSPAWLSITPDEWGTWLMERVVPYDKTNILLWARTDLFYGGSPVAQPASQP